MWTFTIYVSLSIPITVCYLYAMTYNEAEAKLGAEVRFNLFVSKNYLEISRYSKVYRQ